MRVAVAVVVEVQEQSAQVVLAAVVMEENLVQTPQQPQGELILAVEGVEGILGLLAGMAATAALAS